ncbi:hypothetical protein M4578_19785 [Salipiger sp. P9]|uniref:hypothetical protein n=1 Tax=Salipiger pentaromativorans TaxID=2943193 RepID=UPI0021584C6E|nr:hypothetical protein [Salipiger pentaromativorans]MCR8550069.1 hypothetical protein [Salipiger pentaromativorans]
MKRKVRYHAMGLLLAAGLPGLAAAQTVSDVQFRKGDYGTYVEGKVTGHAYHDYRLGAGKGQEMFVELDSGGSAYFNILPPGSDGVAIYNSAINGNSTTVTLPEKGTYTIRVYLMGNDEDSGKTVPFGLDLSIQ